MYDVNIYMERTAITLLSSTLVAIVCLRVQLNRGRSKTVCSVEIDACISSYTIYQCERFGDVKTQVAAAANVCIRLQKVAILLFQFKPI